MPKDKSMTDTLKARAMRQALRTAKRDYDAGQDTANVIAYLTAIVREQTPTKPAYVQLPMFAVAGRPNGKYHCERCGQMFGENAVSRLQSKRAYLTLHCPHCGRSFYEDRSQ